jgi:2-keto-3-deoxy-L-rhamnonate aldolase RhmA
MAQTINAAKARLKKGELAIGCGIRLVRNVDIIKIMKSAGFDWMFIDCEHGSTSIETACELAVAAQDSAWRRSCACPTASSPWRRGCSTAARWAS